MKRNRKMFFFFVLSLCGIFLIPLANASGQTLPKVKHIGIERPKTVLYIGNSFFYFNDSML